MKKKLTILALLACVVLTFVLTPTSALARKVGSYEEMYRLYNPNSGEHFYTSHPNEKDILLNAGWRYEGVAWRAPGYSNTPVYRLYNTNSTEHHYTKSITEKNNLVSKGWRYEGIGWYSDDDEGTPMYRLYNSNAKGVYEPGSHHYTSDEKERDHLKFLGWKDEGIGWYGLY